MMQNQYRATPLSVYADIGTLLMTILLAMIFMFLPWLSYVDPASGLGLNISGFGILAGSSIFGGGGLTILFIIVILAALGNFVLGILALAQTQTSRTLSYIVAVIGMVLLFDLLFILAIDTGVVLSVGFGYVVAFIPSVYFILQVLVPRKTAPVNMPPIQQAPQYVIPDEPPQRVVVAPPPRPARPRVQAWLLFNNKQYQLYRDATTIGRAQDNDIMLPDKSVSRQHAVIREYSGKYIISNKGSTAGVYVNGTFVQGEMQLQSSDYIRMGNVEVQFLTGN